MHNIGMTTNYEMFGLRDVAKKKKMKNLFLVVFFLLNISINEIIPFIIVFSLDSIGFFFIFVSNFSSKQMI